MSVTGRDNRLVLHFGTAGASGDLGGLGIPSMFTTQVYGMGEVSMGFDTGPTLTFSLPYSGAVRKCIRDRGSLSLLPVTLISEALGVLFRGVITTCSLNANDLVAVTVASDSRWAVKGVGNLFPSRNMDDVGRFPSRFVEELSVGSTGGGTGGIGVTGGSPGAAVPFILGRPFSVEGILTSERSGRYLVCEGAVSRRDVLYRTGNDFGLRPTHLQTDQDGLGGVYSFLDMRGSGGGEGSSGGADDAVTCYGVHGPSGSVTLRDNLDYLWSRLTAPDGGEPLLLLPGESGSLSIGSVFNAPGTDHAWSLLQQRYGQQLMLDFGFWRGDACILYSGLPTPSDVHRVSGTFVYGKNCFTRSSVSFPDFTELLTSARVTFEYDLFQDANNTVLTVDASNSHACALALSTVGGGGNSGAGGGGAGSGGAGSGGAGSGGAGGRVTSLTFPDIQSKDSAVKLADSHVYQTACRPVSITYEQVGDWVLGLPPDAIVKVHDDALWSGFRLGRIRSILTRGDGQGKWVSCTLDVVTVA